MAKKRYQWREGNQVELLVDGENYFPRMLAAIASARQSLLLEFYLVVSGRVVDRFITQLAAAAARGVSVRLMIDGFGAIKLNPRDRLRLRQAGVELAVYNPLHLAKWTHNFARDHRKLMLVDQQIAFVGGTGLSDHYWSDQQRGCPWHDVMVRLQGPVVQDLLSLYSALWVRLTERPFAVAADIALCGDAAARVAVSRGIKQQEIKRSFLGRVNTAQQQVWLMTAYFMPSVSVRLALRRAARRGVDVRVIIAGHHTDQPWVYDASKRYYQRLLKAGVRIYEYQPRFLHAKIAVVDDWCSVGSCNLDHWNLRWNLEANIEVAQPEFVGQLEFLLQQDMQQCQEVSYEAWSRRPWYRKLREFVWAWISQLVLRIR